MGERKRERESRKREWGDRGSEASSVLIAERAQCEATAHEL